MPLLRLLVALALLSGAVGCGRAPADDAPSDSIEPTELRIVALAPALGVMCRDLGLEDAIVGKHAWDMALGGSIPSVGTHDDPDLEALLRVRPTHVLVQDTAARVPGSLARMSAEQGWTLWAFPLLTLDDVATAMDEIHRRLSEPFERGPPDLDPADRLGAERPSARLADAWSDRGAPARAAGRVLLLAGVDPPGAMGPGSFHHQLIERLGATPALTTGGPWQELDHEDVLRLAPDAVLIFRPRDIAAPPAEPDAAAAVLALGGLAGLDIPAVREGRVALIDHPLALLPASSLAEVADDIAAAFEEWADDKDERPAADRPGRGQPRTPDP